MEYLDVQPWYGGLKKVKLAGKKKGTEIINPVSGVAFQQREGRSLDHVTRHFKILLGQMCKLAVFPLERLSQTGTVTDGVMGGTGSLLSM